MAIGAGSNAPGTNTVAIGTGAQAQEESGVAIGGTSAAGAGTNTSARGAGAVAVGAGASTGVNETAGEFGVAVGFEASAESKAVGVGERAAGSAFAIAIGSESTAQFGALAMGFRAVGFELGTALGYGAAATERGAIAVGANTIATGPASIAIGGLDPSAPDGPEVLPTTASGQQAIAIGTYARAEGDASIAIGVRARATQYLSVSIGNNSSANHVGSVAIGPFAATTTSNQVMIGDDGSPFQTVFLAGRTTVQDTLTVGGLAGAAAPPGSLRVVTADENGLLQITELTPGSGSGGGNGVPRGTDGGTTSGLAVGATAIAASTSGLAVGPLAVAGSSGTAIGASANASGTNATALGAGSSAIFPTSTAIGAGATATAPNQVVIGNANNPSQTVTLAGATNITSTLTVGAVNAAPSNAFLLAIDGTGQLVRTNVTASAVTGSPPAASGPSGTSLPGVGTRVVVADPDGTLRREQSVDILDINTKVQSATIGNVALGNRVGAVESVVNDATTGNAALAERITRPTVVIGQNAQASGVNATAVGANTSASGAGSTAIGAGAQAAFANSTAIGAGSQTTAANQMMFGTTQTSYVMPGLASGGGPNAVVTVDAQGRLGTRDITMGDVTGLHDALSQVRTRVDEVDRDARRGIAAAMAMAFTSMPPEPGKTTLAGNVAHYRGQTALSFALGHRLNTFNPAAISFGYSYGGGRAHGFRAGFEITF